MKKMIFISALYGLAAIVLSCKDTASEPAAASAQTAETAATAKNATAEQLQEFREESNIIIRRNDERIAELRANAAKAGGKIDEAYAKNIDALEQKNNELRAKVENFKNEAGQDWEAFKTEFKSDTDELRKSLVNFTTTNNK